MQEIISNALENLCNNFAQTVWKKINTTSDNLTYKINTSFDDTLIGIGLVAKKREYDAWEFHTRILLQESLRETPILDVRPTIDIDYFIAIEHIEELLCMCQQGQVPQCELQPYRVWSAKNNVAQVESLGSIDKQFLYREPFGKWLSVRHYTKKSVNKDVIEGICVNYLSTALSESVIIEQGRLIKHDLQISGVAKIIKEDKQPYFDSGIYGRINILKSLEIIREQELYAILNYIK